MEARHTRGCGVLLLSLVVLTTACGTKPAANTTGDQVVIHWRLGLLAWRREMLGALDGISVLFETQNSVASLIAPSSPQARSLRRDERLLAGCSGRVTRLGALPRSFQLARSYALAACMRLERGSRLVAAAVQGLRRGLSGSLGAATGPLSDGQSEMWVAVRTMPAKRAKDAPNS